MDFAAVAPVSAPAIVPTHSAELSVLTYNVRGLPWPVARHRGEALRQIGRELAEMRAVGTQPDVVLIQEGFRREVADLHRASGYRYWATGPGRSGAFGKLTSAGLHIFSDAPIVDVRRVAYSACAGLDCFANKGALLARIEAPGAPTPVEILNTHLNSRRASRAPPKLALAAHNRQTRQLYDFVARERDPNLPLLVGGDFNVKNAAERYDFGAEARPYKVVSEFCSVPDSGCGSAVPDVAAKPWLRSQDLQAFAADEGVAIQPVAIASLFDNSRGDRLSDHDGYLVRYRLTWNAPVRQRQAFEVRPKPAQLGVKVAWTPGRN